MSGQRKILTYTYDYDTYMTTFNEAFRNVNSGDTAPLLLLAKKVACD